MPTQSIPWWSRCTSRPPGGKGHGVPRREQKHGKNPWFIARKLRNPQHYDWADLFCDLWFSFGYNSEDLNKEHGRRKTWWFQMGSGLMRRFHQNWRFEWDKSVKIDIPSAPEWGQHQFFQALIGHVQAGMLKPDMKHVWRFPILFYHHTDPSDGTMELLMAEDELERAETLKLDAEYYLGSNWQQDCPSGNYCELQTSDAGSAVIFISCRY